MILNSEKLASIECCYHDFLHRNAVAPVVARFRMLRLYAEIRLSFRVQANGRICNRSTDVMAGFLGRFLSCNRSGGCFDVDSPIDPMRSVRRQAPG